ncbi:MAG: hypothetical protein ACFCU5_19990 [Pleurocapsa sp.]
MIELLYLASEIQCGAGGDFLNIQVDVYNNQELVQTMMVSDKVLLPVDSVNNLTFNYKIVNNTTSCNLATPTTLLLGPEDAVPSLAGFSDQQSIQDMLNNLNDYEELFLVELGTTNQSSPAFDLQDVVFVVNNNPMASNSIFAD